MAGLAFPRRYIRIAGLSVAIVFAVTAVATHDCAGIAQAADSPGLVYGWGNDRIHGHPVSCSLALGANITYEPWSNDICAPARRLWAQRGKVGSKSGHSSARPAASSSSQPAAAPNTVTTSAPSTAPPQTVAAVQSGTEHTVVSVPLASGARLVTLPGGTPIMVAATDKVSSGTAKVGDTFGLRVMSDVVVDGYVLIAKDAGGQGEVLAVTPAGSHGHAGSLGVQIDWAYAVSGDKVRLSSQRKTDEGENKTGVSSTMTILSWALLGPVGLFAHNWVKGHEMELDSTHPLQAYVDNTVHIVSSRQVSGDTGFAH